MTNEFILTIVLLCDPLSVQSSPVLFK